MLSDYCGPKMLYANIVFLRISFRNTLQIDFPFQIGDKIYILASSIELRDKICVPYIFSENFQKYSKKDM